MLFCFFPTRKKFLHAVFWHLFLPPTMFANITELYEPITFSVHLCSVALVLSDSATPWTVAHTRLLCPWDIPGTNTGVGCHFLLQGIFPAEIGSVPLALAARFFTTVPSGKISSSLPKLLNDRFHQTPGTSLFSLSPDSTFLC